MSIEQLTSLIGIELEDGFIIKSFHIYKDHVNITLVNCGQMKGMSLSYEELEALFS